MSDDHDLPGGDRSPGAAAPPRQRVLELLRKLLSTGAVGGLALQGVQCDCGTTVCDPLPPPSSCDPPPTPGQMASYIEVAAGWAAPGQVALHLVAHPCVDEPVELTSRPTVSGATVDETAATPTTLDLLCSPTDVRAPFTVAVSAVVRTTGSYFVELVTVVVHVETAAAGGGPIEVSVTSAPE